jgi:serine/threonine-protein kinase
VDSATWDKVKDWVVDASKLPPAERDAFVGLRCPDPAIRAEVLAWLRADDVTLTQVPGGTPLVPRDGEIAVGDRIGPYLIVDSLGHGGMGQVFLGNDMRLHRKVALKSLISSGEESSSDHRSPILREARAAAQINHPNVATIHDIVDHKTGTLIVMEYVEGESLSRALHRERLLLRRVVAVGRQLAAGLGAAHAKGVIHRDIKPANIHLTIDGPVKVLDFGVAAATAAFTTASGSGGVESRASRSGTLGYMSPEQMMLRPVDERSDIFSAGIVLFEMATGTRAYKGSGVPELAEAVNRPLRRADSVDPLVPRALADVIAKALDPDPAKRFQKASELGAALEAFERSRAFRALPEPEPVPSRWPLGRTATFAIALGLVIAAAAGWIWWPPGPIVARSVAVLPFDVSSLADSGYLVAGLGDDVARELQQFNLEVKKVDQQTSPNETLMTALGVDLLIMGKVEQTGPTTTLTVQLRPGPGEPVWTRPYVETEASLAGLPQRVADDVAEVLGLTRRANARRASHKANDQAWTAYLRGRTLLDQRTPNSLRRSIDSFKRAADLDPAYAEPWSGMADAYLALGVSAFGALPLNEARSLAREAAMKALERDPDSAEAHTSRAWATFFHEWNWPAAEERFKKAIDLNPQYALAHQWYANFLNAMGRQGEAMREISLAQNLEPLSLIINRDVAWHLFFQRKYTEAVTQLTRTLTMDPGHEPSRTLLARALAALHRYPEALKELQHPLPGTSAGARLSFIGYVQAASGDRTAAMGTLRELRAIAAETPPRYDVPPYYLALIETALGRRQQALDELERGLRELDSTMVSLNIDPRFDSIRDDPRFKALVTRMKFPDRPR